MKATNVVDSYQDSGTVVTQDAEYKPYDHSNLSYAGTFSNPWKANAIRSIEWMTGKIKLIQLIREYERRGVRSGQPFWEDCLDVMGIDLQTPQDQIERIPATAAYDMPCGIVMTPTVMPAMTSLANFSRSCTSAGRDAWEFTCKQGREVRATRQLWTDVRYTLVTIEQLGHNVQTNRAT